MIDDMLVSGQNLTAGWESTHVPMTSGGSSQGCQHAVPEGEAVTLPGDLAKAHMQVPGGPFGG